MGKVIMREKKGWPLAAMLVGRLEQFSFSHKTPKGIIPDLILENPLTYPVFFFFFFFFCIWALHCFQQSFSHIATISGCGRKLNAHFKSAALLNYYAPDT